MSPDPLAPPGVTSRCNVRVAGLTAVPSSRTRGHGLRFTSVRVAPQQDAIQGTLLAASSVNPASVVVVAMRHNGSTVEVRAMPAPGLTDGQRGFGFSLPFTAVPELVFYPIRLSARGNDDQIGSVATVHAAEGGHRVEFFDGDESLAVRTPLASPVGPLLAGGGILSGPSRASMFSRVALTAQSPTRRPPRSPCPLRRRGQHVRRALRCSPGPSPAPLRPIRPRKT